MSLQGSVILYSIQYNYFTQTSAVQAKWQFYIQLSSIISKLYLGFQFILKIIIFSQKISASRQLSMSYNIINNTQTVMDQSLMEKLDQQKENKYSDLSKLLMLIKNQHIQSQNHTVRNRFQIQVVEQQQTFFSSPDDPLNKSITSPHDAIGIVEIIGQLENNVRNIRGTAFLITSLMVLTVANIFFDQDNEQKIKLNSISFSLIPKNNNQNTKKIKIVDYRISKKHILLRKQINKLRKKGLHSSEEKKTYQQLKQESYQYDYALLRLQFNVDEQLVLNYPVLQPKYRKLNLPITICGYSSTTSTINEEYIEHKTQLFYEGNKWRYKINPLAELNGGAVFFNKKINHSQTCCCVMGINQGNSNYCTLITNSILDQISQWKQEMMTPLTTNCTRFLFHATLFKSNKNTVHPNIINALSKSKVLQIKGTIQEDVSFINHSLCQPSDMRLVYTASQHNFSAKSFHQHCNNLNDTFILCRTEFQKTLGAYSYYKWGKIEQELADKQHGDVTDPRRRAFILQLDRKELLVPQINQGVIWCNDKWGPIYGWDGALCIGDNAFEEATSHTFGVGGDYNIDGPEERYTFKSQQTFFKTSGAQENRYFKVKEYEVYVVEWNEENRYRFENKLMFSKSRVRKQRVFRKKIGEQTEWESNCQKWNIK